MKESEKIKRMIAEVEAKFTEANETVIYCRKQLRALETLYDLALEKEKDKNQS